MTLIRIKIRLILALDDTVLWFLVIWTVQRFSIQNDTDIPEMSILAPDHRKDLRGEIKKPLKNETFSFLNTSSPRQEVFMTLIFILLSFSFWVKQLFYLTVRIKIFGPFSFSLVFKAQKEHFFVFCFFLNSRIEKIFGRQRELFKFLASLLRWYSNLSKVFQFAFKNCFVFGKIISLIELCMVSNPGLLSFRNRFTVLPDGRNLEGRKFFFFFHIQVSEFLLLFRQHFLWSYLALILQ